MAKKQGMDRREFLLSSALLGAGVAAPSVLSLLDYRRASAQDRPLRAAMSNTGLAISWCAQGYDAAYKWAEFLGVEITWMDSQIDTSIQRAVTDQMATQDWDFVAIQPVSIGSLVEPIRAMTSRGIPFIGMDTLIAPLDQLPDIGVLSFIAPDNVFMSEAVVTEVVKKMGGKGKIVHTWGVEGHTGSQGRGQGFRNIIAQYPDIEVVDDQPGDWDGTKVAAIWEAALNRHPDITGGFLHNDDMALAARQVVENAGLGDQVFIGGVDAMLPAIDAVNEGRLVATARNSAVRVHANAVVLGWAAATLGLDVVREQVPSFLLADGPAVTANIDSNPDLAAEPWKLRGYGLNTALGLRWLEENLLF